ncbi:MAG: type II toxin-antitoxin system HicA family toxin [Akkermansiaceae bacterium]|nr:type II toxin-antitoxin system HicA family toxin [Akkermansiaceae bacterium]MCP5551221.1 type II toxin-antitoxin system HicA family toxin [Akkermansiaceae bacterium]
MPKLGVFSGKEVCALLSEHGFAQVRTRGSHAVMQKRESDGSTRTVPVPLHTAVRKGTLNSIIRQSGLDRSLFLK